MKRYLIPLTLLLAAALFAFPAAAAITADFSYTVDASDPLTIHFTDKSTGNVGNWFWSFGDGKYSNDKNPEHTYDSEGEYHVSLAAQAPDYSEEKTEWKTLIVSSSGVTDDGGGSSGSSSSGGNTGGGISLPSLSLGGISIPNPLDLISEYIKLIRVMVIPGNYNF